MPSVAARPGLCPEGVAQPQWGSAVRAQRSVAHLPMPKRRQRRLRMVSPMRSSLHASSARMWKHLSISSRVTSAVYRPLRTGGDGGHERQGGCRAGGVQTWGELPRPAPRPCGTLVGPTDPPSRAAGCGGAQGARDGREGTAAPCREGQLGCSAPRLTIWCAWACSCGPLCSAVSAGRVGLHPARHAAQIGRQVCVGMSATRQPAP